MRETIWLIRKTFRSTFKNVKSWLLYLGLPVVAAALAMLLHGSSGESEFRVGIVNHDSGAAITQEAIDFVGQMDAVNVSMISDADIHEELDAGDLDMVIVFPAAFSEALRQGNPLPIDLHSVEGVGVTDYLKSSLNQFIDNRTAIAVASQGDAAVFDAMVENYVQQTYSFTAEQVEDQSIHHNRAKQTIGYLLILMLFASASLSGIILKEKENRTYFRMLTTPISGSTYVFSNTLLNLFIMILQVVFTLMILTLVFRVDPGISILGLLFILTLFAFVAIGFSLVIVAFAKTTMEATGLQALLFIPTSLLAGCLFPLELMPDFMERIAYFMPQYWVLDTIDRLQLGQSWSSLSLNLVILLAFALTLLVVAIYKFNRNNETGSFV
ncbi:ABC transporter permease [Paenibacillus sp. JCM 10914]|uniref:ABC transporter permease n=1 Tax=Paenibacillus sp. JCM 10914 TaxID=1236974 RepID=UPI0003CCA484|nr:ABC transporter permease [Paenibacillus sp. JCM 10914]GAE06990.1 hypothetical protein JCM10914_3191 [Paenibacillus sp. JCM 10914]